MLPQVIRRAARVMLQSVHEGSEVAQQVALNSLEFCPDTVIKGYLNGFFPMPDAAGRISWRAPEQRGVMPIDGVHVPGNLKRLIRQQKFEIRIDTQFEQVIRGSAERSDSWITEEIISVYRQLHEMGIAHSVEAWQGDQLAGGLYGILIGRYFSTESQFHRVRDAGKVALIHLTEILKAGQFQLHDVQYATPFLEQFGSTSIPAPVFRQQLLRALVQHGRFELVDPKTATAAAVPTAS